MRLRPSWKRGFTLLEVILAITISTGLLIVALLYHRQATVLRSELLLESEKISAARQFMDRVAADLRSVPATSSAGFAGTGASLKFVMAAAPNYGPGIETDLKLVSYSATMQVDGTNLTVTGVTRVEKPLVDFIEPTLSPLLATETTETNLVAAALTEPLTEVIHFLRFRFYDGSAWRDSWQAVAPPLGLEVSLGFDPLPEDATPDKYPYELFRRLIVVPAGTRSPTSTTNQAPVLLSQRSVRR